MDTLNKLLTLIGWGFAALSGLCVVAALGMLIYLVRGDFAEEDDKEKKGENAIAVVDLEGEIFLSEDFRKAIKKQVDDDEIKGIVVRINSPGGSVGASEEIYRYIKKADQKKPVICALGSVAASGGLYSAAGCRKIISQQGTITGSIGVIMMMPQVRSLLDRFGVEMTVIKSGSFKDAGSPFRILEPAERELLQNLVSRANEQFVTVIAESRGLAKDVVRSFADGRIMLGETAKELGLVDEFGGLTRAAEIALAESGGSGEPKLVMTGKPKGIARLLKDLEESSLFYWLRSSGNYQLLYRLPF